MLCFVGVVGDLCVAVVTVEPTTASAPDLAVEGTEGGLSTAAAEVREELTVKGTEGGLSMAAAEVRGELEVEGTEGGLSTVAAEVRRELEVGQNLSENPETGQSEEVLPEFTSSHGEGGVVTSEGSENGIQVEASVSGPGLTLGEAGLTLGEAGLALGEAGPTLGKGGGGSPGLTLGEGGGGSGTGPVLTLGEGGGGSPGLTLGEGGGGSPGITLGERGGGEEKGTQEEAPVRGTAPVLTLGEVGQLLQVRADHLSLSCFENDVILFFRMLAVVCPPCKCLLALR